MEDGRVRPVDRARLSARRLRHDRGAGGAHGRGRAGSAASTTPTSATRSATGSSTRSGRRSRSAAAAARRPTSPTSTTGRRSRARPEQMLQLVDDARAEGLDVTFDLYPSRVGEHAAADHAADVGPGGRRAPAQGAPRRPRGARPDPGRDAASAAVLFAGGGRLAEVRLGRFARPEHLRVGGPDPRATTATRSARDAVDAICDLLLAEDLRVNQVTPGPHRPGIRPVLPPPGRRWSGPTACSSATSRRRGRTARTRGSSASSCASSAG